MKPTDVVKNMQAAIDLLIEQRDQYIAAHPESGISARLPGIEQIAERLAAQGLTIVSAADAEKVKRCDCDDVRRDAERYRWLRDTESDLVNVEAISLEPVPMGCEAWRQVAGEDMDTAIDAAMGASNGR